MWLGVDAHEERLVDAFGGLVEAIEEAKGLAGIDPGARTKVVSYPKKGVLDRFLPKDSSEPAPVGAVLARVVAGGLAELERRASAASGVHARLDGDWRIR